MHIQKLLIMKWAYKHYDEAPFERIELVNDDHFVINGFCISGPGQLHIHDNFCKSCGGFINFCYVDDVNKRLYEKGICYVCDFWDNISNREGNIVIEGKVYVIGDGSYIRGFGGRTFKIRLLTGQMITTNDLWFNGEIPKLFRDKIPDNASLIIDK